MNKTIISILIWLVCMPCMAVAETSKELEEAKEEAKKEVLAANSQLPPQQLLEAITNKVHEFVGDAEQSDDLTTMAVHYTPYYQMVIN